MPKPHPHAPRGDAFSFRIESIRNPQSAIRNCIFRIPHSAFRILLLLPLLLAACRGDVSTKPPLHGIRNMDLQLKYVPQSENPILPGRRAAMLPVAGTVERGALELDPKFYEGKNPDGSYLLHNPRPVTRELLLRGQDRYNIYCGPCHDRVGTSRGIIVTPAKFNPSFPPPPSFHDDRIRIMPDGEVFNTISNGIRTMPSYRHQVPVADRWAIIAYLRALERSQRADLKDLRPDEVERLKQ